jgi:VCBS repeat-containing protein
METYKNLENGGKLKVSDPEGQKLTFTVTRQPKRGDLELREDGTFTYTPKKNKVGVDSFTYTATDPAGNVSREATVTIQIIKPTDAAMYTDTAGTDCQFTAEWLKNTGIFAGEQVGNDCCFNPDRTVTRGEFLVMTMKALGLAGDENAESTGFEDQCPGWLKPYLAAAQRSGLVRGYATETGAEFRANDPITGAEAASMVSLALDLPSAVISEDRELPVWAATALATVNDSGIAFSNTDTVTRAQAANALYQAVQVAHQQGMLK